MNRRLLNAIKSDLLFQFRSGFHWIYVVISIFYIMIINLLPDQWGNVLVPFVIFSDPSVLGFFFIGGLIMLEKGQGILALVTITPLRTYEYLLSKIISLNLISLLASLAIALFTGHSFAWLTLILAVILTASVFTLIGIMVAIQCQTVNQYFGRVILWMLLIILPCFSLIGFPLSWLFYSVPSVASAKLFIIAFSGGAVVEIMACSLSMGIWFYVLMRRVARNFDVYSIKEGV